MSDIGEKVKAIIVDNLGVDATEVSDIQIPDDKAEAIATVGDAIAFIEEAKA